MHQYVFSENNMYENHFIENSSHQNVTDKIKCINMFLVKITGSKLSPKNKIHQNIFSKNDMYRNIISKNNMLENVFSKNKIHQNVLKKITCIKMSLVKQHAPKYRS